MTQTIYRKRRGKTKANDNEDLGEVMYLNNIEEYECF